MINKLNALCVTLAYAFVVFCSTLTSEARSKGGYAVKGEASSAIPNKREYHKLGKLDNRAISKDADFCGRLDAKKNKRFRFGKQKPETCKFGRGKRAGAKGADLCSSLEKKGRFSMLSRQKPEAYKLGRGNGTGARGRVANLDRKQHKASPRGQVNPKHINHFKQEQQVVHYESFDHNQDYDNHDHKDFDHDED